MKIQNIYDELNRMNREIEELRNLINISADEMSDTKIFDKLKKDLNSLITAKNIYLNQIVEIKINTDIYL